MSFKFSSVGHVASAAMHDFVVGVKKAESFISTHKSGIEKTAETIAADIAVIDPAAGTLAQEIVRAGEFVLGQSFTALQSVDAAASANGVNITLDKQAVADLKALFENFTKQTGFKLPASI